MSIWANLSEQHLSLPLTKGKHGMEAPVPSSKRAKTGDSTPSPVEQKLEVISMALSQAEFKVPGPETNRQMLLAMAPAILGTSRVERHEYQQELARMFATIFEEEEARLQLRVEEERGRLDGADAEKTKHEDAVKEAEATLQAKLEEIKQLKLALASLVRSTKDAELKRDEAVSVQVDAQDSEHNLTEDKTYYADANDCFTSLRDASSSGDAVPDPSDTKQRITTLKQAMRKLKADPSLLTALSKALAKPQEARGDFDSLVVEELASMIGMQQETLAGKLQEAADAAPGHQKAVDAAQEVADKAKAEQVAHAKAVLAAMEEKKALARAVDEAKSRVEEHAPLMEQLSQDHAREAEGLQFYQKEVLGACTYLMEREADEAEGQDTALNQAAERGA